MPKKIKENSLDLYYVRNGQDMNEKNEKKTRTKKIKERENRIKQKKVESNNDLEDEIVIQMTNKNNLIKEQNKRKEINKKEQKRAKKIKKIKIAMKTILFLGIVAGGIVFATTSPIFNIKEIKILNNNIVSSEEIISLSSLKTDENIFKFNKADIKNKIKENAYIEEVQIHRKIPKTVEINIIEREPKYSIDFMEKYAYINTQGYILEISDDNKGLVVIQGISTNEEEIVPNNRLNTDDLIALEDIIKIMNIAKENNLESKVTSIDISNKNDYSLYIEEEKKRIHLGDNTNLGNKILYAIAIIEQEKESEGDIYVNGDLNNKFQPFFRKKV